MSPPTDTSHLVTDVVLLGSDDDDDDELESDGADGIRVRPNHVSCHCEPEMDGWRGGEGA